MIGPSSGARRWHVEKFSATPSKAVRRSKTVDGEPSLRCNIFRLLKGRRRARGRGEKVRKESEVEVMIIATVGCVRGVVSIQR